MAAKKGAVRRSGKTGVHIHTDCRPGVPDGEVSKEITDIIARCDGSWQDTLYPSDEKFYEDIPVIIRLYMGFMEIMGYLVACTDYNHITETTRAELEDRYSKQFDIEVRNCIETKQYGKEILLWHHDHETTPDRKSP
jgi:hypothetical protein